LFFFNDSDSDAAFWKSVNDVYELENLPFLDGVIQVHGKENTVTMLPGDFVAPSLLSSLDKGKGMIDMLNRENLNFQYDQHGITKVCTLQHLYLRPKMLT
jgi:hypothetical protein